MSIKNERQYFGCYPVFYLIKVHLNNTNNLSSNGIFESVNRQFILMIKKIKKNYNYYVDWEKTCKII